MSEVHYALQAFQTDSWTSIASIDVAEVEAQEIIKRLRPTMEMWWAPGSDASFRVVTQAEIDVINSILKGRHFDFSPEKYRCYLHVYSR